MAQASERRELRGRLRLFAFWAASSAIDCAFLMIWVTVQRFGDWFLTKSDWFLTRQEVSGLNQWVLTAFHLCFAVTTLAPVLLYVYSDVKTMVRQVAAGMPALEGSLKSENEHD